MVAVLTYSVKSDSRSIIAVTMTNDESRLIQTLKNGGIAVVRTDTVYGVIACADDEMAVERVYSAKQRDPSKQCIVLLASSNDAPAYNKIIEHYSQESSRPTSVVVPASSEPQWLLRGGNSIAYRVTKNDFLRRVIQSAGPVIAPSANKEGEPPAHTIAEAMESFGDAVECYVDGGRVPDTTYPSRIIRVQADGAVEEVRA